MSTIVDFDKLRYLTRWRLFRLGALADFTAAAAASSGYISRLFDWLLYRVTSNGIFAFFFIIQIS